MTTTKLREISDRLDRIQDFRVLERKFEETPEISLAAFLRHVGGDPENL